MEIESKQPHTSSLRGMLSVRGTCPHTKLKCLLRKQIENSFKLFGVGAWWYLPGREVAGVSGKAKQEIV